MVLCSVVKKGVVGLFLLTSAAASDQNTTMMRLLGELKENGTISQEQYQELMQPAKKEAQHFKNIVQTFGNVPYFETEYGKLIFKSQDGEYKLRVRGRLDADVATFENQKYTDASGMKESVGLNNGSAITDARLGFEGILANTWDFKFVINYAGSKVKFNDFYFGTYFMDNMYWRIGQFYEPMGLEEQSSSEFLTFMTKSQATDAFAAGRHLGTGLLVWGEYVATSFGVFGSGVDADNTQGNEDFSTTARGWIAPVHKKTAVAHFGGAASYVSTPGNGGSFELSVKPDSKIANIKTATTGTPYSAQNLFVFNTELLGIWDMFSVQGEYWGEQVYITGKPDRYYSGWYGFISWIITGESRGYSFKQGVTKTWKPANPLGKGAGAWEVAARYDTINLQDKGDGTAEENFTFALNWYPYEFMRVMFNYVQVTKIAGAYNNQAKPSIFQMRFSAFF